MTQFDRYTMRWDGPAQVLEIERVTLTRFRSTNPEAEIGHETDFTTQRGVWFMRRGDAVTETVNTVEEMLERGWIEEVER